MNGRKYLYPERGTRGGKGGYKGCLFPHIRKKINRIEKLYKNYTKTIPKLYQNNTKLNKNYTKTIPKLYQNYTKLNQNYTKPIPKLYAEIGIHCIPLHSPCTSLGVKIFPSIHFYIRTDKPH